jgi:adenylate cyclase
MAMVDPEGSRKLTAILAADVAGYSRLMQLDDRATVASLEAYRGVFREHVAAHEGRIVDTAGDSVLAVFDSPIEAVRAASDIQSVLAERNEALAEERRMRFRIGVNLGDVISKADGTVYGDGVNIAARLENIAEPGGITISGTVFDHVKNRLQLGFDFIGEQEVKNIAESVRAYRVVADVTSVSASAQQRRKRVLSKRTVIGAVAAAVVLVAVVGIYAYHHTPAPATAPGASAVALPLPDKPSIAVLPFVNMSEDPKQEYFSDGMTEDVITSLSKLSGLFVIARNSVFTYKGRVVKPEQVSRELGVRYVLEGSVRKADKQVRITAQLIDASTGYHLWAEHYDGDLKDVFALQDGVTQKIVTALSPKLTAGEESARGRRETTNVEAYDLVLRGVSLLSQGRKASILMARQMFEQAIVLDPNYAKAYARLAWTYFLDWLNQWTPGRSSLNRALEAAKKAVAVDESSAEAHLTFGWNLLWTRQQDLGVAQLEKAVALDPNFSEAYAHLAEALNLVGRPDEAIGLAKKAMRLDPHYPPWVAFFLGNSYYELRRYDEAIAAYQEALRRNPDFWGAHQYLAATYAEQGRQKEAHAEAAEVLRIYPGFSVNWVRDNVPFKNQADLDRSVSGLRKAGLK